MPSTPPPSPGSPASLTAMLRSVREQNREAAQELPSASELPSKVSALAQDTNHLKTIVYGIIAGALAGITMIWQMYLHTDDKIEHKMDYLNGRIDAVLMACKNPAPEANSVPTASAVPVAAPALKKMP